MNYDPMIKIWSTFNFFGQAVWIIQDGKESIRSDAYFPEWKPALIELFTNGDDMLNLACNAMHCALSRVIEGSFLKCL